MINENGRENMKITLLLITLGIGTTILTGISYLRKKLMFIGTTVQIVSVRGVGYKLETENAER